MSQLLEPEDLRQSKAPAQHSVTSLAQIWAKKYLQSFATEHLSSGPEVPLDLESITSREGRLRTAETLRKALRYTSAQAWSKTETLLAAEVQRYQIDQSLIDPWQIAEDSQLLFDQALAVYTDQAAPPPLVALVDLEESSQLNSVSQLEAIAGLPTPGRLSVQIAPTVGQVRQKYTAVDPRVLGFVSMQFHYSGQHLLELLSPLERALVSSYFKVIDDHLYMPLQRSYEAAANYEYNAPELKAVRQLLPISTEIARNLCQRVSQMYGDYHSHSGLLNSPSVKVSSIRDVEMFQVYLCLCVLEGGIAALQQELFPLCVMLYPPLQVRWELVRHMLRFLGQEISYRLPADQASLLRPYHRALWEMFSPEVLSD